MSTGIDQKFTLGESITPEQMAFFDTHGFIHFEGFARPEEVAGLRDGMDSVQAEWLSTKRKKVNGIPIKYGKDVSGDTIVQRYAFTSLFSDAFHQFVNDARFEPVKALIG